MKPESLLPKNSGGNNRGQVEFADASSFANAILLTEKVDGGKFARNRLMHERPVLTRPASFLSLTQKTKYSFPEREYFALESVVLMIHLLFELYVDSHMIS